MAAPASLFGRRGKRSAGSRWCEGLILMENYKGSSSHGHQQHQQQQQRQQQISFATIPPPPSSSSSSSMHGSFVRSSKEGVSSGVYDLGELDQALFMYLDGQDHSSSAQEQLQTLNIFPSQPMHVEPSTKGGISLASPSSSGSKKSSEQAMDTEKKKTEAAVIKKEGSKKGKSRVDHEGHRTTDPKTLRRLAQNREAARKSRLRKKAYIQQLETSRVKLSQLEQDLQRARVQGILFSGGALLGDQGLPAGVGVLSPDAAAFNVEYARWVEEHRQLTWELRAAAEEVGQEKKVRMFVDGCLAHYEQMTRLKDDLARSDVFHLISGLWLTPAERCFMWMGGFRPSDVIKVVLSQIEPLTEHQILGVCGLQQSTQEAEEALTQGLEALNQSLLESVVSDSPDCMVQMAAAINKLSTLEGFVRQADGLRQQTLHRLYELLTTRQMARCLVAIAEYFHRLRALSSLWVARPRPGPAVQ